VVRNGFLVPFALLMIKGTAALPARAERAAAIGLPATCVLASALWLTAEPSENPNIFTSMPRDVGVMAPTDLSPEMVYLTDKRIIAVPFDPELLDRFIDEYPISYIVTSNESLHRYESPIVDRYTSALVSRYIVEHPEKYRLVHFLREDYPAFYPTFEYYVFQTGKATANRRP
jgi:hypothetical protein